MCLIYSRTELQNVLHVSQNAVSRGAMGLLAVTGSLCLVLCWRRRTAVTPDDQLVLLPDQHSARRGTLEVSLTPRDFRLLDFPQSKQGAVVTKDELYDVGWGRDFMPNSRAQDQHMINFRKKLDPDKSHHRSSKTCVASAIGCWNSRFCIFFAVFLREIRTSVGAPVQI